MPEFSIDPITRIEGHMAAELKIDRLPELNNEYVVTETYMKVKMFRGFELFLKGRDPRDAVYFTPRICGVCPNPHSMTSVLALDDAFDATPPPAAILVRNIIEGFSYLYDHTLHFYILIGPELGILSAYPPMVPPALGVDGIKKLGLGSHYAQYVEIGRIANEAQAIWAGKFPHIASVYPGGVTVKPTVDKIAASITRLVLIWEFVALTMMEDLKVVLSANERIKEVTESILGVPVGLEDIGVCTGNFLSYGIFPDHTDYDDWLDPSRRKKALFHSGAWSDGSFVTFDETKIQEDVKYSFYDSPSGLHPSEGETSPKKDKAGAYTWTKAPRYDDKVYEVGPLARMLNTFGTSWRVERVHPLTGKDYGPIEYELRNPKGSILDRVAARAFVCMHIANKVLGWLSDLKGYLGTSVCDVKPVPSEATGRGLWEAPRGALGHWITIKGGKIDRYQCVVPGTWNWSPRDDKDRPGPGETALTARLAPEVNGVWVPTLNVVEIANAIAPDLTIEWPATITGWGNILAAALTGLHPKLAGINMEVTDTGENVNSSIPLTVIRSFDPCLACGVHLIMPNGKRFVIELDHHH